MRWYCTPAGTSFPGQIMATTTRLSYPRSRPKLLALGTAMLHPTIHTFYCWYHEPCRKSRIAQCSVGQAASPMASAAASPMASSQARFGTNTWLTHEICVHRRVCPRPWQSSEAQELPPQSQRSSAADKGCAPCSDWDASPKARRGDR